MCNFDPEERLSSYLDSFSEKHETSAMRIKCCDSSRSLYCSECCRLLIPESELAPCLQKGTLKLPFDLHVIMQDRRASATGLHAMALLQGATSVGPVTLVDVERGESIPEYQNAKNTYLLFPCADSVPLSAVETEISTLVVLDCKWNRSGRLTSRPILQGLPRVHLSRPPLESYFWRWHNEGAGKLSTIEAIYFASAELAPDNEDLVHLMFLFGMQRAAIAKRGLWKDRKALPFTGDGKEEQRALRRRQEHKHC